MKTTVLCILRKNTKKIFSGKVLFCMNSCVAAKRHNMVAYIGCALSVYVYRINRACCAKLCREVKHDEDRKQQSKKKKKTCNTKRTPDCSIFINFSPPIPRYTTEMSENTHLKTHTLMF